MMLVRVFAALDAITGGDEEAARSWLRAHNNTLRDTPLAMMQERGGLAKVSRYLEARLARAKVAG